MNTVYIEKHIREHPRVQEILSHLPQLQRIIECDHYSEVFNPKSQNFRLQKKNPALILAEKRGNRVLPTPEGFGIGSQQNYYFSHMLNCIYDCRYCFLQGMYHSANYVLFINYEDFMQDILHTANNNQDSYFFSGYDCDSIAYNPVTGFLEAFIPFFAENQNAILELRTKSSNVRSLLSQQAIKNCVVAYSFTPKAISEQIEYKVPALEKRLKAIEKLSQAGWQIGLRFDPLIYASNYKVLYAELIESIFQHVSPESIHSISIGPLRFPKKMYKKIVGLYPKEKLLAQPLVKRDNHFSYTQEIEDQMKAFMISSLKRFVDNKLIFECSPL